ncbi:uncharacterized protein APUU_20066S [Aspergillus puulaauensis]|uniref:Nucleoside phosphorylase domain-containing protein n=1 Tax=Aspergillus puulaauensis TaxID=1220207 RepID=A0A7R7XFC6_9EURO|nr:uncharacterized protein APUU_20066S [Aspergillus puulaauensis]BCS19634.1 hypothetical protein APUU_20066S [Aspergillus puulaauensis]
MASETPSPAKQCPSQVNFTIGWICVLQKEYRAALAILDETYDHVALARGEGDRNHYVFGRVGEHYVVINLPPSGWHGRIRASTIASDMRSSFPRMRFVLIVGIAGGAPSPKEDVRLGDVVLGTQVVPWNTGKWTQHGFQRTGMTRAPPRELLEAITFFDQRLWSPDTLLLSKSIDDIASKAPTGAGFARPTKDRLYKPGFAHTESICDCLQAESGLPGQLCWRDRRDGEPVRVFQGAIGSDDVVMKNSQTRDAIAQRENVLCFEMEADGVMDIMPCLPVRGISDYADEHKNDDWQLYAALTAAICGRELLLSISRGVVARFPLTLTGDLVDRYMKGAFSRPNSFPGSETERLRQNRDTLIERRDFLRELVIPGIRQKQRTLRDDSPELRDEVQRLKDAQKILKEHLQDLKDILNDHCDLDSSPDPAIREEYQSLKTQLQRDLEAIESFASITGGTLKNTGHMLTHLSKVCKNQSMNVAGTVFVSISTLLGRTMNLWRSSRLPPEAMWEWVSSKTRRIRGSGDVTESIHLV